MKISKKILKIVIIVGIAPVIILLLTQGLNILFAIGTWVHPYVLVIYGISLILLGLRLLVLEYGSISNLFKKEFGKMTFTTDLPSQEENKNEQQKMIPLLGIGI